MTQFYQIGPQLYDDQFWWKNDDLPFWKEQLVSNGPGPIIQV